MMKNGCQQGHNIKYLNTDSHWTTPRHIAKINIALLKNRKLQLFQWCLEKICTEVLRHCINTVFLIRSIISDIGEPCVIFNESQKEVSTTAQVLPKAYTIGYSQRQREEWTFSKAFCVCGSWPQPATLLFQLSPISQLHPSCAVGDG